MGRKKIAENSMVAHFRINNETKAFLEDYAKKHKMKFSVLARNAMDDYAKKLMEDIEIEELKKLEDYKGIIIALEKVKGLISTAGDFKTPDILDQIEKLNKFSFEHQNLFPEGVSLANLDKEIANSIIVLDIGIARQYLLHHKTILTHSRRIEETQKYVGEYTTEFAKKMRVVLEKASKDEPNSPQEEKEG